MFGSQGLQRPHDTTATSTRLLQVHSLPAKPNPPAAPNLTPQFPFLLRRHHQQQQTSPVNRSDRSGTDSSAGERKKKMGSASRAVSCLCCPCKCLACGLFSCLCSILVSLLVTAGVLALILYLIFRPHMITATADSASLARFDLAPSNSALAYNLSVDITVRNPNKRVGLYYDDVESLALFEDQRFGYVQLQPFYQGTEDSTRVSPQFHGQEPLQGDVTAANFRSQQQDGKFAVDVTLKANLRVKVWAFKVRGPKTKITCPLSIPAPGSKTNSGATFQPADCRVWF